MCSLTLVSSSACRGSFHSPVAESARSATSISTLQASNGLRSSTPADCESKRTPPLAAIARHPCSGRSDARQPQVSG